MKTRKRAAVQHGTLGAAQGPPRMMQNAMAQERAGPMAARLRRARRPGAE